MPAATNPLPQLIPARIQKAKQRVEQLITSGRHELVVMAGPVSDERVELAQAQRQKLGAVKPNTFFGRKDGWQHRWFRVEVPAPKAGEKGRRHLRFACQGEHTAYLDGVPWAGFDCAHATHLLPDRACTLWIDTGIWATGIWAPGHTPIGAHGARFDGCAVELRDEHAWNAFWDLDCLLQYVHWLFKRDQVTVGPGFGFGHHPPMEQASPLLRRVLADLDDGIDIFDRSGADAAALPALRKALAAVTAGIPAETWQPVAALCGHAHIDLVWLWPEKATERKGIHTFATQLRLMERYPEFVFVASQPALYRAIERLEPKLMTQIAARMKTKQWEAMGGFEVEPDNQLPSGEALARSLIIGQHKLADLTGKPSRVCWIPDVFGYAACLPQILRLGAVDRFYTTKMTWSAITKFPYSSFVWKGNDGSAVLTHLCSTGYNGDVNLENGITKPLDEHRQAGVHPELLLGTGLGDGGGGVTEAMCERARRLGALRKGAGLANVPKVTWSRTDDFFDRLEAVEERLPVYQGELYLEYHRGTFTTQSEFKRLYRRAETALQAQEAVRVARGGKPISEQPWQRVAFAQFHDAIPGSSINIVYAQMNPELAAIGDAALTAADDELGGTGGHQTVFNPLPQPRTVTVELPAAADWSSNGIALRTQRSGSGRAARSLVQVTLPALGAARLEQGKPVQPPAPALAAAPGPSVSAKRLANGRVDARFDAKGRLIALTIDGMPLPLVAPAGLRLFHDEPAHYDAWDIDHATSRLGLPLADPGTLSVVASGPLRAIVRGSVAIGNGSSATIDYIVDAGEDLLRVEISVDWRERHRLLRYHLPTGFTGPNARYGLPFGAIDRPQIRGTERDEAMWEVPGSRWAAVLDGSGQEGLAILTEAKFGFACREGDLGLSLLRSPTHPDEEADQGRHVIRFAIGRYRAVGDADAPCTAAAADAAFAPVVSAAGGKPVAAPFTLGDCGSLVPSWVLPSADGKGYIVRFHETAGRSGAVVLELAEDVKRVDSVDFLENVLAPVRRQGRRCRIAYGAYQIVSIRVTRR